MKKSNKRIRKSVERFRVSVDIAPSQKASLEIIRDSSCLDYACLVRYAIKMMIEQFTVGKFSLRDARKFKLHQGRKKKCGVKDKTESV